jgi:hypothetical protein
MAGLGAGAGYTLPLGMKGQGDAMAGIYPYKKYKKKSSKKS